MIGQVLPSFIAQEVEKVLPEWVGVDPKGFKTLNITGLDALLVESVRALKAENDDLRAQSSKLESRLTAMERNRGTLAAGPWGIGTSLGLLGMVGGAFLFSRRRRSRM